MKNFNSAIKLYITNVFLNPMYIKINFYFNIHEDIYLNIMKYDGYVYDIINSCKIHYRKNIFHEVFFLYKENMNEFNFKEKQVNT